MEHPVMRSKRAANNGSMLRVMAKLANADREV